MRDGADEMGYRDDAKTYRVHAMRFRDDAMTYRVRAMPHRDDAMTYLDGAIAYGIRAMPYRDGGMSDADGAMRHRDRTFRRAGRKYATFARNVPRGQVCPPFTRCPTRSSPSTFAHASPDRSAWKSSKTPSP
jgi:hypothetical protein